MLPKHPLPRTMPSPAGKLLRALRQHSRRQPPQSLPLLLGMTIQTWMMKVCTPVAVETLLPLACNEGKNHNAVDWTGWSPNVKRYAWRSMQRARILQRE